MERTPAVLTLAARSLRAAPREPAARPIAAPAGAERGALVTRDRGARTGRDVEAIR